MIAVKILNYESSPYPRITEILHELNVETESK